MSSHLNGARMCQRCGEMSPSPSDDKPYSEWIKWHVVRMACADVNPKHQ